MSIIIIVDTSIFLNVLDVPGRNQDRDEVLETLKDHIEAGDHLLLPFAAIVETGNHIAHLANGHERRKYAEIFCERTREALKGKAPWKPMEIPDRVELLEWLNDFPEASMREISLGDHSIIKQFEKLCSRHPSSHIKIWAADGDLSSYERIP